MNIGSIVNGVYNTVAFLTVVSVVWVCIKVVSDRFRRGKTVAGEACVIKETATTADDFMEEWETMKYKTVPSMDINEYFDKSEIMGKQLVVIDMGQCDLPSGKVLVCDPFTYLFNKDYRPFFLTAPVGSYSTEVWVVKADGVDRDRYAAVRLRFSDKQPVAFYEALADDVDLSTLEQGYFIGFGVDSGMCCICDEKVRQLACDWLDKWKKEHPDEDEADYFNELFKESYAKYPEYQSEGGDWLNWNIPGTDYHVPILSSGFGDGSYPVFWGFDRNGDICQLLINLINIRMEYEYNE